MGINRMIRSDELLIIFAEITGTLAGILIHDKLRLVRFGSLL